MQRYKNLIVLLLVLLIIILGGSVWYKKFYKKPETKELVNITNIDLTKESGQKIPRNFPTDIPLQGVEIIESYEMEYAERGVVVSIVNSKTNREAGEIFENYKNSLINFGYLLDDRYTNQDNGTLHFVKKTNTLTITIIPKRENTEESEYIEINMVFTSKSI